MAAGPVKSVHGAFSIPSLDGIRAVAVLIVFVGHGTFIGGIWPGHVGVTIFFFLSGYLITTLLRREREKSGRISLGKFYLRRALRILPPAYITIALAVLVGTVGLLPATTTVWGVLAEVFHVTNYYMVLFGRDGLPPETSMLWSLSVEEHFYLVLPAVLIMLLWRRMSWRRIGHIFLAACVAALAWRVFLYADGASFLRLYVASDTRFDGLLAGAAMALLFNPALGETAPFRLSERTIRFVLAPIAAIMFAVTAMAPDAIKLTFADTLQYVSLMVLFWVVIRHPEGALGRILNRRWVAHIGVLSFTIYLLHRMVIALVEQVLHVDPIIDLVSLLITIGLAQLMYVGVEKPLGKVRKNLEARGSKTATAQEREKPADHPVG